MKRTLLMSLMALGCLTLLQPFASAQESAERQQSATYAGLYLTLRLGDTPATADNRLAYGFKAGFRRDWAQNTHGVFRTRGYIADMMRLDFSERGFQRASLIGQPIVSRGYGGHYYYLDNDGDGKKKRSLAGSALLWTGGILAAILIAGNLNDCTDNVSEEDEEGVDFCVFD